MAISVTYSEVDGWPKSRWENGEFVGDRRLRCAWGDRYTLISQLDTYPDNQWPYPDGPDDAIIRSVAIQGIGKQGASAGLATYLKALLDVRYSTLGPRYVANHGLLIESLQPNVEAHERDHGLFRWDSNSGHPLREGEAPQQHLYFAEYVLDYRRALALPGEWLLSRIGSCNSNPVGTYLLGLIFPVETMLYVPPTIRTSWSLGGAVRYDFTLRYKVHPVGWNYFWRQSTAQFERMYIGGGDGHYVQYPSQHFADW